MDAGDVLRAAFEAYSRRDVDATMEHLTDDVEIVPALGAVIEGRSFVGRAGVEDFFASLNEMWSEFAIELGDLTVAGDRVLSLGRVRARAVGSGLSFDQPVASITELRDGRIARWSSYMDVERALTLFRETA